MIERYHNNNREIAEGLVSQSRPGDFNQALMELGARVCTPQGPDCGACPIKAQCHAYAQVETHSRLKANGFWKATPAGQKRKRDMEHGKYQKEKGIFIAISNICIIFRMQVLLGNTDRFDR